MDESYKETKYQVIVHGARNVETLKNAFSEIEGRLESDMYGSETIIENFQEKTENISGEESSVFFLSGTMAECQQMNKQIISH